MGQTIAVCRTGEMLWRERESVSFLGTTTATIILLGEGVFRDHLMSEAVLRQPQHDARHSVADAWHPALSNLAAAVEPIWHI